MLIDNVVGSKPPIDNVITLLEYICNTVPDTFTPIDDVFTAVSADVITIEKYVHRVHTYGPIDHPSEDVYLVVSLIYMDRYIKATGSTLYTLNVHRLWLVSYMLAIKFLADLHYNNKWFAKVGGISLSELNVLEKVFLTRIQFHMHVDMYVDYARQLGCLEL